MAAKMERTRWPGIFKRGRRYVVTYRVNGRPRKEAARTLEEARRLKAARETDRNRGELHEQSVIPFSEYGEDWIDSYQGTGRRDFTEGTRDSYRRDLRAYAYPFLGGLALTAITPRNIARWIAWLCDEDEQGRRLADATLRRIVAPVRSCLATAKREGLIRHNPADGLALPHRPQIEDDEPRARALTREQLGMFLRVVHPDYRLMFSFLASSGLRFSEMVALRWCDLELDGSTPRVKVRRAIVKGRLKPPKSEYGRRDVPLNAALVQQLRGERSRRRFVADDDPLFASSRGNPPNHSNLMRRYLKPAAEEVGVPWAGFHTFRHTCASMLFEDGRNIRQVQQWLGHHSPSFTLDTYVHLLDEGIGDGLDLETELGGNRVATREPGHQRTEPEVASLESAL